MTVGQIVWSWSKVRLYPNNRKTRLLVTPDLYAQAVEVFVNTDLEIVSDGVSYLGGVIGSEAFICLRRSSHG